MTDPSGRVPPGDDHGGGAEDRGEGAVTAWPVAQAWSLLSPVPDARVDLARWGQHALTFFAAELLSFAGPVAADGALPARCALEVALAPRGAAEATRARLVTLPLAEAPGVLAAAHAGVLAIGGAGFDVLVARASRVWQVAAVPAAGPDARVPLVLAALLAFALTAPIVPPGGGTIFGVKGARERLGL